MDADKDVSKLRIHLKQLHPITPGPPKHQKGTKAFDSISSCGCVLCHGPKTNREQLKHFLLENHPQNPSSAFLDIDQLGMRDRSWVVISRQGLAPSARPHVLRLAPGWLAQPRAPAESHFGHLAFQGERGRNIMGGLQK